MVLIFSSHPTKRSEAIPLSIVGEGRLTVLLKDASSFGVANVEFVGITSASQNKVRQSRTMMLGQLIGHDLSHMEKRGFVRSFFLSLAEREGSELPAVRGVILRRAQSSETVE